MIELKGKYNTCKVYTDNIDNATISQLLSLLNQEVVEESQIRIMSDCHSGKGSVIGTTMTIKDKVIPNLVGSDVGCGMLVVKLKEKRIDLPKFDSIIRKYIPFGGTVHEETKEERTTLDAKALRCYGKTGAKIREDLAYRSVGTLGGGNHFIELEKDKEGSIWLVIHTGSRHLGLEICEYYQNAGYETHSNLPFELAYVEGQFFEDYIHDMKMVQEHAACNRAEIARVLLKQAKLHEVERFETVHNYIDTENKILRKGSVSAKNGERLLIPINMRDGSLLCMGKGNPDGNYSAPHGAGRLMSRSEAKESISISEFKNAMEGIYTTCVNRSTIDESPMAYKPIQEIM